MIKNTGLYGDGILNHRNALNGDAVILNGINQHFKNETFATNLLDYNKQFTIFCVCKPNNTGNNPLLCSEPAINFRRIVFYYFSKTRVCYFLMRNCIRPLQNLYQILSNIESTINTPQTLIGQNRGLNNLRVSINGISTEINGDRNSGAVTTATAGTVIQGTTLVIGRDEAQPNYFGGKIKRLEILKKNISPKNERRAYNEGTLTNIFPTSDFELILDGDNYNTGTGEWLDFSTNNYVFNAVNAPTKGIFL